MALDQQLLLKAKNIVANLPEEQKQRFISQYSNLDESKKEIAVNRLISQSNLSSPEISKQKNKYLVSPEEIKKLQETAPSFSDIGKRLQAGYQENVAPLAEGASSFAFGIPRMILHGINPDLEHAVMPEQTTIPGKIIRGGAEAYGLFKGLAEKFGENVAMQLFPKIASELGLGAKAADIAKFKKTQAIQNIFRSMTQGSVMGGTQIVNPELDYGQQAAQAVGGGLLGGAGEIAVSSLGNAVRAYSKYKSYQQGNRPDFMQKAQQLEKKVNQEYVNRMNLYGSEEGIPLNTRIGNKIKDLKRAKELELEYINKEHNRATKLIQDNIEVLKKDVNNFSDSDAVKFQQELPEFYHNNGKAYRSRLDEAMNIASQEGKDPNLITINNIIDKTINDLDEAGIVQGLPRQAIEQLKEKYAIKNIGEANKFMSARTGEPVGGAITTNAEDTVPLMNLINDLKGVRKVLSMGAKSGTKRFTPEDVAVSFLEHNLGSFVKEQSPGFSKLQESYTPIIQAMKKSNEVFKPYKGQYYSEQGSQFLQRSAKIGEKIPQAGEESLLNTIENGSEFSKGIGNISQRVRNIGNQIKQGEDELKVLTENQKNVVNGITKNRDLRIQQLQNRQRNVTEILANKKIQYNKLQNLKDERLKNINEAKDRFKYLIEKRQKTKDLIKSLAYIFGAVGGGAAGGYAVIRGTRGISGLFNQK